MTETPASNTSASSGNSVGVEGQTVAVAGDVVGGNVTRVDDHRVTINKRPGAASGRMSLKQVADRLERIDELLEKIDRAVRGDDYSSSEIGLVRTVAAQGVEQKLQRRELNKLRKQVRWLFAVIVFEPIILYFVIVLSRGWWS